MITATFKKHNDLVSGYKIDGHANYAPKGQDIICAAVSSLAIATANTLDHFNKCEVTKSNGLLVCIIKEPEELTTIIMQPLLIGLKGVAEEYPEHVKVVVEDGQET